VLPNRSAESTPRINSQKGKFDIWKVSEPRSRKRDGCSFEMLLHRPTTIYYSRRFHSSRNIVIRSILGLTRGSPNGGWKNVTPNLV